MRLWRITTRKWALDRQCYGARNEGGRWNPIGYPVLYAGASIEICALERFVHLASATHPPLVIVAVDVPDDDDLMYQPALADLPLDWSDLPISSGSQDFGRCWIESGKHLVMMVPSAVIPEARNAVINPRHPAYPEVTLQIVRPFTFDSRMFVSR